MTCTFCGSLLDGTESECPYCGHRVNKSYNDEAPVEPKKTNHAADMFSKFSAKNTSEDYIDDYEEEEYEPPKKRARKSSASAPKSNPSMIVLIGCVALLLLSLINMFLAISANSKIKDLRQDLLSQLYQIQTTQNELSNNVSAVGNTVGNLDNTMTQSELSRNITITKQPTEAATYVGRGAANTEGETLNQLMFSIEATGSNLTYAWQKFDETSGSWVTVQFDPDNNYTYGLHVYNLPDGSGSQLAACGLTELAFGSYRCVISDTTGLQYSDTVKIVEVPKG